MRNSKARPGTLLLLTAIAICFLAQFSKANGEELSATSSESKPLPEDELGTGNFSHFPFRLSASVRGGYDDNVTTSKIDPQDSFFTNAGVLLNYDFGSPRTQMSLQAGAGVTYYWDHIQNAGVDNNDYDINTNLSFSLTYKATPRLTLSTVDYVTYQTEPDFALAQGINRRSGNFFYTQDKGTVIYLWAPRFSTATSYTLGALRYDESSIAFFEDRIENTFGNEFRFLLWPTTTLVGEYRFQIVSYESINRDSTTNFALAGFDHNFNPRLNMSFRGGAEFRDYDVGASRSSPYFESTVNYAVGKQTSVSWTARYAIEEPDILLNPSRETFRTGLQAKHDFTPRISGSLGAYYEHDDFQGINTVSVISPAFTEESVDVALSLRYTLNHYFGIEAGYNHTEVWSDVVLREYSRNRYWAGLNLIF